MSLISLGRSRKRNGPCLVVEDHSFRRLRGRVATILLVSRYRVSIEDYVDLRLDMMGRRNDIIAGSSILLDKKSKQRDLL